MPIQHKYYINLDTSHERRIKFLGKDYRRWDAVSREEIPEWLDNKMRSMWNFPKEAHLGRCGCFASHMELYKYIVKNEFNDVLIVEDDAVLVKSIPTTYPKDGITYVGGFFHPQKMMSKEKVVLQSKKGINYLPSDYRVLMSISYIIPTWEIAKEILDTIEERRRYKAIDIMLGDMAIHKYYEWPACYVEEGSSSTIAKKQKKSNAKYEWVKI